MLPRGCEIKDVARSTSLQKKSLAFIKAEAFEHSPAAVHWQQQIYKDSGLHEESADTILELKGIMNKYREHKAEKDRQMSGARGRRR
jgi:hypothetical protein